MDDMVDIVACYGGQLCYKPCRHYRGGFKTSIPADADRLCTRTILEDFPKIFEYHKDSKAYYKVNGESFAGGLKEVTNDADINKMRENAHKVPNKVIEIFVDHNLPKDHPDYDTNREKVKNMKRIEPFVCKLRDDEYAALSSDGVSSDDEDEAPGEKECVLENEVNRGIDIILTVYQLYYVV